MLLLLNRQMKSLADKEKQVDEALTEARDKLASVSALQNELSRLQAPAPSQETWREELDAEKAQFEQAR